jgi:hypothetical protein
MRLLEVVHSRHDMATGRNLASLRIMSHRLVQSATEWNVFLVNGPIGTTERVFKIDIA